LTLPEFAWMNLALLDIALLDFALLGFDMLPIIASNLTPDIVGIAAPLY
jgi:hypothetical protein